MVKEERAKRDFQEKEEGKGGRGHVGGLWPRRKKEWEKKGRKKVQRRPREDKEKERICEKRKATPGIPKSYKERPSLVNKRRSQKKKKGKTASSRMQAIGGGEKTKGFGGKASREESAIHHAQKKVYLKRKKGEPPDQESRRRKEEKTAIGSNGKERGGAKSSRAVQGEKERKVHERKGKNPWMNGRRRERTLRIRSGAQEVLGKGNGGPCALRGEGKC